eukprot:CAMPEP_0182853676 /NCGR_PEP_ID=MMETSP0034_2-20130328/828_1 /TAXON_ID=156128 /ORGANISM="Nephroselmis pyriformis, Strain CCMP717" /LENGTH=85 /DNA_ID=CAMNT_0024984457 /DNA_START=205 /DNA_END=458 /DNA_ORIENTATION=-
MCEAWPAPPRASSPYNPPPSPECPGLVRAQPLLPPAGGAGAGPSAEQEETGGEGLRALGPGGGREGLALAGAAGPDPPVRPSLPP